MKTILKNSLKKSLSLLFVLSLAIPVYANDIDKQQIKTLTAANNLLLNENEMLYESLSFVRDSLSNIIENNENVIKKQNETIDDYKATFIEMASNFLYIPYDEYSINEVAIPAFEKAKGSSYYNNYAIRLEMLKHYKEDINYIIKFLNKALKDMPENGSLTKWAQDSKAEFGKYAVVRGYQQYGDDWQNTYLGKYIVAIFTMLSNESITAPDAHSRIKATFSKYQRDLNSVLNPKEQNLIPPIPAAGMEGTKPSNKPNGRTNDFPRYPTEERLQNIFPENDGGVEHSTFEEGEQI